MREHNHITFEKIRYKYITVLFILVICVPFLFVLFGESKTYSSRENRALNLFPAPLVSEFFTGNFQVAMEGAFKDQLFGSETMKYFYNQFKSFSTVNSFRFLEALLRNTDQTYQIGQSETNNFSNINEEIDSFSIEDWGYHLTVMNDMIIRIDETNHLVLEGKPREIWEPLITNKVANINLFQETFSNKNVYVYYVETDFDVDLVKKKNTHDIVTFIEANLSETVHFNALRIDSLADFNRFFISDHHWNQKGQLEGYQNIVTLLGKAYNQEAKAVVFEGSQYIGSRGRRLDSLSYIDVFGTAAIPNLTFDVYVNQVRSIYNNKNTYLQGSYTKEVDYNHYVSCNGYDEALLQYDFSDNGDLEEGDNLLVFVDSFSNPINDLIASHYNQTYIIDLRHWERDFQVAFDINDFMTEHDIDDVLFLGYYVSFSAEEFLVPLE